MPRYAKGSAAALDYDLLIELAEEQSSQTSFLMDAMRAGVGTPKVGAVEKLQAIRSIMRCNQMGWVLDDVAVQIIGCIAKGEQHAGTD